MACFIRILLPVLVSLSSLGTVHYDIRYKLGQMNLRVATAAFSWEQDSLDGIPVYHGGAIIRTTPFFRLFIGSDYIANTYLRRDDLSPMYFFNPFKNERYEYVYRQDTGEIESTSVRGPRQPVEYDRFPFDGRTMDLLTLLHFIRFLDESLMKPSMPIHVLISGKIFPAEIIYQGKDAERFPGIQADRILLRLTEHGLTENGSGNEVYLWRSPGEDRCLLGLETELSTGSMHASISSKE